MAMTRMQLAELEQRAQGTGFNLLGLADGGHFDLCQPRGRRARELLPSCETVLVLGTGGREFWRATEEQGGFAKRTPFAREPLRTRALQFASEVVRWLASHGHAGLVVDPEAPRTLNFTQLGEAAGLGTISPVTGLLLHPKYGPWLSMRAAILLPGFPFGCDFRGEVTSGFQPCMTCHKPCVKACPIQVYDGEGGIDLEQCATHLHAGGCATHCAVRRACPVGAEERYDTIEESYRHGLGTRLLRRTFGLGWWRFVPRRFRER